MAPKGSIASMVKPVAVAKPKSSHPIGNLKHFAHPPKVTAKK